MFQKLFITKLILCSILVFAFETKASDWPDIPFKNASGEKLKLSEFEGQVLVVKFWATWCGYCIQQMPVLSLIEKRYSNNENVKFLPISIDYKGKREVENFYQEKNIKNLGVYTDQKNILFRSLDLAGVPSILIISKEGGIVAEYNSIKDLDLNE